MKPSILKKLKSSTAAIIAGAAVMLAGTPEAEADILTLTGNATITEANVGLTGTDFEVGNLVSFNFQIDTDVTDDFPALPTLGIYEDAVQGSVNVGSGFAMSSTATTGLTISNATSSPDKDSMNFGFSDGEFSSSSNPNSHVLSGIFINSVAADHNLYSDDSIDHINSYPDLDTGSLTFIFNLDNNFTAEAAIDFNSVSVIPEPSTLGLVGLTGLAALLIRRNLTM